MIIIYCGYVFMVITCQVVCLHIWSLLFKYEPFLLIFQTHIFYLDDRFEKLQWQNVCILFVVSFVTLSYLNATLLSNAIVGFPIYAF